MVEPELALLHTSLKELFTQTWKIAEILLTLSPSKMYYIYMHYTTCSPLDPLQWMGAVRMRVQRADKNITIIHK